MVYFQAEHSIQINQKISSCQKLENKDMYRARVLLVEDVPIIQTVHLRILENLACKVDLAKTGQEALNLYRKNKYDLIFLDLGLPDISGIEICRIIREEKSEVPIVVLTAFCFVMREKCIAIGVDDFLQKPVSKEILQKTLIHWIQSY